MMKTRGIIHGIRVTAISVLCMMSQIINAQYPAEGHWEGDFMEDFKTLIKLEATGADSYSGTIQMFDGMGEIQNDKLSKITIEDNSISFYIEAKKTDFKGSFNVDASGFSGNFIFPDQSLHPIELQKVKAGDIVSSSSDWR